MFSQSQHLLQSMIEYFHTDMNGIVQLNKCSSSEPFDIRCSDKQGCVPQCYFLWSPVGKWFRHSNKRNFLRTRSYYDRLFNLARVITKTTTRGSEFADDAAVATHTELEPQPLYDGSLLPGL